MLTYKLDPATLTLSQLNDLTKQLGRLATDVSYNQAAAQLTIDGYGNGQRAIEDLVMPYLPVINELPDARTLAALSKKRQRQSA